MRGQALRSSGVSHVVQLEQWLMEGAYNKVGETVAVHTCSVQPMHHASQSVVLTLARMSACRCWMRSRICRTSLIATSWRSSHRPSGAALLCACSAHAFWNTDNGDCQGSL